jgi:hypothetical protein
MRTQLKVLSTAVGTAIVVGALAVGTAGAQTASPTAPWSMREAVHEKVAAALGVPEATLEAALTQARGQVLDEVVAAGQLTRAQADWMTQRRQWLQRNGGLGVGMMGGRFAGGAGPGARGRVGGRGYPPPWMVTPTATR